MEDPPTTGIFTGRDAVLACYEIELEVAGPVDEPDRTSCPDPLQPLVLPADPARALPPGTEEQLKRMLRDLLDYPPSGLYEVRDGDVGVSVYVGGGHPCLLGARRGDDVTVRRQAGPGASGCSPADALAGTPDAAPPAGS